MKALAVIILLAGVVAGAAQAQSGSRAAVRTNQQGNNFKAPTTKEAWLARKAQVRQRILTSCGLNPMPQKTPLNPQVYGKMEKDGYTIEKVVLETYPGFYVAGNLYRPIGKEGKLPGILNPHGHWTDGRFPVDIQARCVGQARMGAVAFSWDMVGFGDSNFGHTFTDDELTMLGLNLNGLQLWDSIRVLDWLTTLPDVDPAKIAVTGESGGGTQTFELCAVDDRPAVAAPVCMVSAGFQGGCECENAPNKRVGTDNVEFAACFAPKPMILIGATGDWTSEIMQQAVPQIREVYKLLGAEGNLSAVVHKAPHNYNQTSRESVYTFFKQTLWGEKVTDTVKEASFVPESQDALSVWDADHPRPSNYATPQAMRGFLRGVVEGQVESWKPVSSKQWKTARAIIRGGLNTILACDLPTTKELSVESGEASTNEKYGYQSKRLALSRATVADRSTALFITRPGKKKARSITVVVHPKGTAGVIGQDGAPDLLVAALLRKGDSVLVVDPFLANSPEEIAKRQKSPYYATYNATVLADRVQDILNAVAYAKTQSETVNLTGVDQAGTWVLLARPFAGPLNRCAADAGWEWPTALPMTDEMALPAARRYGGMKAYAALSVGAPIYLFNYGDKLDVSWVQAAAKQEGAEELKLSPKPATPDQIAAWLTNG